MSHIDFQWIDTPEALQGCVSQWLTEPLIAVDTEFFRERTYYAALGLIQVCGASGVALIDPLAIQQWAELLKPVLISERVEKVFHAGEEDLEIFTRAIATSMVAVRDSQFLYGLVSAQPGISYINLVAKTLDVALEKSQTRSDWMQRPLSDAQKHYAAADVFYLYRLYPELKSQVIAAQRWSWMDEEGVAMALRALPKDPSDYYLNLRQGADLRGNRLWLLQQLALHREQRCQQLDRFRKGLISDADLVLIARHRPASARELALLV
jgi:ribonuclease D